MKKPTQKPAKPFSEILTSCHDNIQIDDKQITSGKLRIKSKARFSIHKHTLHGGKQEGVELVIVDNGKLQITIIPTRGMGVFEVKMGDVRLGWDSPVKEVVHPHFINLPTRGGLGWLEGFNEWMVRCGLENCGGPGRDEFITNIGTKAEMDLSLHGKIANIPASEVEVVVDRQPPHRIRIRGRVDERMLYGPKLELWTEISTEPGSNAFRVEDRVTNRGASEQEFQLLYHVNFGAPLLEAGSQFIGAMKKVTPFNEIAAKSVNTYTEYAGPTPDFIEQVYCLVPIGNERGQTTLMLQNAAADRAASMTFSVEQLPCLSLWKNTASIEEGYVTGIEPSTGYPNTRRIERQRGRVPKLQAGESRPFAIDYAIHATRKQVQSVSEKIAKLQANRPPQVSLKPGV